jgi:hypothetical protein
LRELFRKGNPGKIKFGFGYRWRTGESNLLPAVSGADMDTWAREIDRTARHAQLAAVVAKPLGIL